MRGPQVEPASRAARRSADLRGGPAGQAAERAERGPPAAVKAEFIRRLAAAGLPVIETTSFVPPTWVPQLSDAAEVLELLGPDGLGRNRPVRQVPNERGLDRALAARGAGGRDLRQRHRDLRAEEPQPLGRRLGRDVPARGRAVPGGRAVGPRLCLDVLRGPMGG